MRPLADQARLSSHQLMELNMTNQLTFTETNTTNNTLKVNNVGVQTTKNSEKSLWETFVAKFWDYTEKTGKSDTSSFDGIL